MYSMLHTLCNCYVQYVTYRNILNMLENIITGKHLPALKLFFIVTYGMIRYVRYVTYRMLHRKTLVVKDGVKITV